MQVLIVVLLIVLIGAVLFVGMRMSGSSPSVEPVVAPAVDPTVIAQAVKTAIDVNAIATGVRGAVETQMLQTAQQVLAHNNQEAEQRAKQTLAGQSQALDQQARLLLQPFEEKLRQLAESVTTLQGAYQTEQGTIGQLAGQLSTLQESTTSLKNALKSPTARGSWGENQLRNVLRIAGMENYCDFTEQYVGTENERLQKPDCVVNLPTGGRIAIDSKAPLAAYLRMTETDDVAQKEVELKQHAKEMRAHMKTLAEKRYWDQFGHDTPDFVVMFIPGEGFVADAMKADTTLMDDAMKSRVLIASPVNLLALLLTIAKGWQMEKLQKNVNMVAAMGKDLHERIGTLLGFVVTLGNGLKTANTAYNSAVGSIETRLLVTLRDLAEMGIVPDSHEKTVLKQIDTTPRVLRAPELDQIENQGELPPGQ